MTSRPPADIRLDAAVAGVLADLARPHVPAAAGATPVRTAEGWDCSMWRWGDALALRIPRRSAVADAVRAEQRHLGGIAARLGRASVAVPAPLYAGTPQRIFPFPWSVVPWIPGGTALDQPRAARTAWAETLGESVRLLHAPAPADAPVNPYRGVPLADRDDTLQDRLRDLRAGGISGSALSTIERAWHAGLAAPPWSRPSVWIHGDLHPGNVVVANDRLVGIIDWIDLTAGDPASDLAAAWLTFDAAGRDAFRARLEVDDATWVRARAWAAFLCALLFGLPPGDPYRVLAEETVRELA